MFSPTESIGVIFKIGLYGGLILATPVFIYEFFAFIVPGLTSRERRMLAPGLIGAVLFLAGGMSFAYWIILPASLGFLLDVGGDEFDAIINAKEYIDFATRIIFWVGVAFEGPMVMALAARLGLVRAKQMLHFWRYAIVVIFIMSAIITPTPDPLNQSLVAGPLSDSISSGSGWRHWCRSSALGVVTAVTAVTAAAVVAAAARPWQHDALLRAAADLPPLLRGA